MPGSPLDATKLRSNLQTQHRKRMRNSFSTNILPDKEMNGMLIGNKIAKNKFDDQNTSPKDTNNNVLDKVYNMPLPQNLPNKS